MGQAPEGVSGLGDIFDDLAAPEANPERRAQELSRPERPKRFYKTASVGPEGDGHVVLLDGKPVRTPARKPLAVPSRAVAEALAEEWAAQGTHIDPATMPLTRLVNSAIDGVADKLDAVLEEIARYGDTDLILYRAETPERLVARQAMFWDPIVAWSAQRLGLELKLAHGVIHVAQPADVTERLKAALPRETFRAAALHTVTTITGSAFLALAVNEGRITLEQAFEAANVDEDWNIELWGADAEATQRRAYRKAEIEAAGRILGAA
jgi:chaperone required for assembly of F1-ATPase